MSTNKNNYRDSKSKRFQRNSSQANNSLNYNLGYNKDTKSAMKMSVPIWNDFFPLFLNISYH